MHSLSNLSVWDDLPAEMKYTVVEHLDGSDIPQFSKLNREAYSLSIPSLYRVVNLRGSKALRSFLDLVPGAHCRHVRTLSVDLSMDSLYSPLRATTALSDLLSRCTRLEELSLSIPGSLKPSIIPCFPRLRALRKLCISNCGRDENAPLSERLVVSIAASTPHLSQLILDRVCRSALHAPELVGAYPFVPVLTGDDDIPPHPLLGDALCLPSLLRLPTLRELRIRDTHLGDTRWGSTPVACALDVLELGSCCYESPEFNRACADRIVAAAGHAVRELHLGAPLACDHRLAHLRALHLSPLLPVEHLVETLAVLARSPIDTLSLACHEDDLAEEYVALDEFLGLCAAHAEDDDFFSHLETLALRTVSDLYEATPPASPRFQCQVRGVAAADVVKSMQERLQEHPDAGIQEDICSSDACAFAALPVSDSIRLDELIAEEEMQWCTMVRFTV
ncbi:hypothetical protein PHLGIDRAFT_125894 [Phlebiopsis gigantea 11061_1 CR5-6]|uniref:F-box domain-containing protein n=1 Tax=Phlebiopsis gigantea (strain 11061_1 CR5-6) TaxID=745531 RepID=A0A0C3PRM6_PHLG1|nr:hypothetical protein PHLGIDRAFT_125894 [Phlebiopsis gigantea 11061_1 CR5-6]